MTSTTTSLRDDTTLKSLSTNERLFLRHTALPSTTTSTPLRLDGRTPLSTRPISLHFSRTSNRAECTSQYGPSSRVTCIVSGDLIPPTNMDRPNEGVVRVNVDMSPMACMGYENVNPLSTHPSSSSSGDTNSGQTNSSGPMEEGQKLITNRILRILERTILNGGVIDSESLCVQSGAWVWRLNIDVTILDFGGNVVDVSMMAVLGALRHYRKPQVDVTHEQAEEEAEATGDGGGMLKPVVWEEEEKEPTPLPLHHTPLSLTYALYSDMSGSSTTVAAFLDPTDREELVSDGTITISFNKHGEICSLDFPGGCEMKGGQIVQCVKLAEQKCGELCGLLERGLEEAEKRAGMERLERLKVLRDNSSSSLNNKKLVDVQEEGLPYVSQTQEDMEIEHSDLGNIGEQQAKEAQKIAQEEAAAKAEEEEEEEEAYRLEALDYARMHVAAKVKEDSEKQKKSSQKKQKTTASTKKGGSLMEAMLKSASSSSALITNTSKVEKKKEAVSSSRTMEADDEFERYAAEAMKQASFSSAAAAATTSAPMSVDSDDDDDDESEEEEEEVTTLQSEFGSVAVSKEEEKESPKKRTKVVVQEKVEKEEDVEDLAMAVVEKKKKKKGKKSKKGKKAT